MMKKYIHNLICVGMLLIAFSAVGIPPVSAAPPAEPSQPVPSQGSSGVTVFVDLQWTCGETNLTYDIYFGTEIPPPLVSSNQMTPVFEPDPLQLNTTYYWQIVAYNALYESTQGPIWSFTTASNQPPFKPTVLDGPPTAGPGIPLEFYTVAPDPEGDDVYYQWDWGDGTISDWFGPYDFGEQTSATYQWSENGSYEIKVRAQDSLGKTSDWSLAYSITIEKQVVIENCKSGYLYFKFFTFDKTYGYIYSLDLLGMSLIISAGGLGMSVYATGSDAVDTVIFEMKNRFLEDQRWNATSNNLTGNSFEGNFYLMDGLYETSVYAYDGTGRLIDKSVRQYVIYYEWKFVLLKQLLGLA
ncbi:MAG: PKD domain-containing protein [Candidatus Thermoplasmatota archaeon]|nr:PKD domain-containing protein [Candidatus Thermoplasmatota archaeon]